MSENSWLREFFEMLGLVVGALVVFIGIYFLSWLLGLGVEYITGSTLLGFATFGVSGLLLLVAAAVTFVRFG